MESFSIDIVDFNDGHYPGGTSVGTKIAQYKNKQKVGFFSVFDSVLPMDWSEEKAYDYALDRINLGVKLSSPLLEYQYKYFHFFY